MTTSWPLSRVRPGRRAPARWPVILLPLIAAGAFPLFRLPVPQVLFALAVLVTVFAPAAGARVVPFALLAYGGYGFFLAHTLLMYRSEPVFYGVAVAAPAGSQSQLVIPRG